MSEDDVRNVTIPLPTLSEQRRIVEILDQADHLRRLRSEADAKMERILPALFIEMFGEPTTNPLGWPMKALAEISLRGPEYGANAQATQLAAGEPRYVRITDIDERGCLREDSEVGVDLTEWAPYQLEDGDLLFARSGATVGKVYLHRAARVPCVFAGYLIRFRLDPSELLPVVAFAFTRTPSYRSWVSAKRRTAAQPNINGQEFAGLRLPVPKMEIQRQFASRCEIIGVGVRAITRSADMLESLFGILLRQAFGGGLTAAWRSAHMAELLAEMKLQAESLSTRTGPLAS